MRSLPGRAGLSRSDVRGARWDATGTATADGPPLSKKEKNGLLTLCGNRDGGTRSRNPRLAPSESLRCARDRSCSARPESRRMASSRACASACASRAPGPESVKVQDAKLAADPTAALALGGVFGAKRKHLAEWDGCKNQDDCALGGTIGATCPGVLARSAASSPPPPQRHTPQPHSHGLPQPSLRAPAPRSCSML